MKPVLKSNPYVQFPAYNALSCLCAFVPAFTATRHSPCSFYWKNNNVNGNSFLSLPSTPITILKFQDFLKIIFGHAHRYIYIYNHNRIIPYMLFGNLLFFFQLNKICAFSTPAQINHICFNSCMYHNLYKYPINGHVISRFPPHPQIKQRISLDFFS